jgi:hypothetical protein
MKSLIIDAVIQIMYNIDTYSESVELSFSSLEQCKLRFIFCRKMFIETVRVNSPLGIVCQKFKCLQCMKKSFNLCPQGAVQLQ